MVLENWLEKEEQKNDKTENDKTENWTGKP